MAKHEFVQLAHVYKNQNVSGWLMSEKLDGQRCYWDGGMTRGMLKADVPWANTAKDERYKVEQVSTGLWSRYGNVIHAPAEWLDQLPAVPLDGELYVEGYRQDLMKAIKKLVPDLEAWANVKYHIFDIPPFSSMFPGHMDWIKEHKGNVFAPSKMQFTLTQKLLKAKVPENDVIQHVEQIELPRLETELIKEVASSLETVVSRGGEGLMLRNPHATYENARSRNILKVKPVDDAEGTITGYIAGKGKYLGMIGAVILTSHTGVRLELSGFTNAERWIDDEDVRNLAFAVPGEELDFNHDQFPLGTVITYKYRGLTKDNVPVEARYWRKHD